jgi:hypothetical protein
MNIELGIFILIFIAGINCIIQFIVCDSYLKNRSGDFRPFTWNSSRRLTDAEANLSPDDPYTTKIINNVKKSIIYLMLGFLAFIMNIIVIFWYAYKTGQI